MYVCLYEEQNNKKENRESCVTVRYKNKFGMYNSNGFEVYKLWCTCFVRKCCTATTKMYRYNEQMACILTRSK